MNQGETRVFTFGCSSVSGRLLWQADFAPNAQWLFEAQGGTLHFSDGRAIIDCVGKRGATLWVRRSFPADVVVEYAGTCVPPSVGHNLNCFLAAGYADGRRIDAVSRTGAYAEYHAFGNYIVTLTNSHTRVRRDPGFFEMSELMLGSQIDHRYLVQIAKTAGRIRVNIDGRLIHDVTDAQPHGGGWVALRTWETKVIYDHWAVYEPVGG